MTQHLRSAGLPAELPIRFFDESYFVKNYMLPFGVPYAKVFQQMMKLHAFDIPGLLPNIVIMDSDTIWGQNYTFVYPNGTGSCKGFDTSHFIQTPCRRAPPPCPHRGWTCGPSRTLPASQTLSW